jgi:hypothetical protein
MLLLLPMLLLVRLPTLLPLFFAPPLLLPMLPTYAMPRRCSCLSDETIPSNARNLLLAREACARSCRCLSGGSRGLQAPDSAHSKKGALAPATQTANARYLVAPFGFRVSRYNIPTTTTIIAIAAIPRIRITATEYVPTAGL